MINKFLIKLKIKNKPKGFSWSALSSREQKKIIKNAVRGSNRLQKELFDRAQAIK